MIKKSTNNLFNLQNLDELSHAYLFYGEAKDEMRREAQGIAMALEVGNLKEVSPNYTLIDAMIIDAENASSIGIDIVREIKNFLSQKPFKSKKRTVVVLGAEELTTEAQNAILKILEDAPKSALIILIAKTPERLLPTVISRLQKIYIPSKQDLEPANENIQNARAKELALKFLKAPASERRDIIKEIILKREDFDKNY